MNFDVNDFRMRYPEMSPYVGNQYNLAQEHNCALLVIGESHYLPDDSTVHKDCATWYISDHTKLNQEERGWINTSDIICKQRPKNFPNQAHWIWRFGYQKINEWGPKFDDYRMLFPYMVFFNFYLRPANQGNTFKELCTPQDNFVANANFQYMVEQYQPNGIVFLSRLAFESCGAKNMLSIPVAGAPHPTCRWWNRKCSKYGGRFGRDLVQEGMIGFDWKWTRKTLSLTNIML